MIVAKFLKMAKRYNLKMLMDNLRLWIVIVYNLNNVQEKFQILFLRYNDKYYFNKMSEIYWFYTVNDIIIFL